MTKEKNDDQYSLLLVDDDPVFLAVLEKAMRARGFATHAAPSIQEASVLAQEINPEYAVVDLSLPDGSGLELVKELKTLDPNTRIVVLTGYGSIATAVEAVKLGAVHYLAKPADADEIISGFHRDEGDAAIPIADAPMSVNRLEWEHLQRVLNDCDGNISKAARQLKMHRRTLQRKLQKRPVKE